MKEQQPLLIRIQQLFYKMGHKIQVLENAVDDAVGLYPTSYLFLALPTSPYLFLAPTSPISSQPQQLDQGNAISEIKTLIIQHLERQYEQT